MDFISKIMGCSLLSIPVLVVANITLAESVQIAIFVCNILIFFLMYSKNLKIADGSDGWIF